MSETFVCSICEKTFDKTWSDEEAKFEAEMLWGRSDNLVPVCHDCFLTIVPDKREPK